MWHVYFLELRNGDIYVGSTNDLRRRFGSHQQGQVLSARSHLPVALRSYVAVANETHARELERCFKSGSGKAFAMKRLLGPIEGYLHAVATDRSLPIASGGKLRPAIAGRGRAEPRLERTKEGG
ncbi:GIY-YIG nuclease family protein [Bradyrhizobium prioriisuperbiae]|uniref:GIY-YIG nuclease family protein n=1 Tax=Bradyrhizobium prioriisuperbiae TaxID=2854389 RepID=UPI0028EC765F|nr:GIY-YIG nuclease family protein [Bradyrhizobium prioritasuperba]